MVLSILIWLTNTLETISHIPWLIGFYTLANTLHMISSILSQHACFCVCDIWYRFVLLCMGWNTICKISYASACMLNTEHIIVGTPQLIGFLWIISWPMHCPWYNRNMLSMGWHTDDSSHISWPTRYQLYTSYVLVIGCYSRYAI